MGISFPTTSPVEAWLESALPKIKPLFESSIDGNVSVASLVIGENRADFLNHLEGLSAEEKAACVQAVKCVALPFTGDVPNTSAWFTVRSVSEMTQTPEGLKRIQGLENSHFLDTIMKLFAKPQSPSSQNT